MPNYRREWIPGVTYFFTVVTYKLSAHSESTVNH